MHTCENCGKQTDLPATVLHYICRCGQPTVNHPLIAEMAKCAGCKFRIPKGCALYIRPCLVQELWKGELDPPEQCPNRAKFNSIN